MTYYFRQTIENYSIWISLALARLYLTNQAFHALHVPCAYMEQCVVI